jgi:hypothetical protein
MGADNRQQVAEQAAAITTAVVAAHGRGLNGAQIARALKLTGREVWLAMYYTGLTNNSDEALSGTHPRQVALGDYLRRNGGLKLDKAA